ncbi:MFS transporter [Nocardia sp. NPDC051030]|uniref:MFS transporter n=1 Tax=Nocardia sp. NPDC051030 TaxID=3155162 RepID=UPI00341537A2
MSIKQETAVLPGRARSRGGLHTILIMVCLLVVMTHSNMPTPLYSEYGKRFPIDTLSITVIYAMYALGVSIALIVGASLVARFGERLLMIAGLISIIGSNVLFIEAGSVPELLVARVLTGLAAGAFMSAGTAAVVELASEERRPFYALLATACNILGMGLGPVIGGFAAVHVAHPIFWVFSVHLAVAAVLAVSVRFLPARVSAVNTHSGGFVRPAPPADDRFRIGFYGLCLIGITGMGVLGLLSGLTPTFLHSIDAGISLAVSGLVIGSVFGGSAVAQLALKRIPIVPGVLGGTAGVITGLLLFSLAIVCHSIALYVLAAVVCGLGQGMTIGRSVQAISAKTRNAGDRVGSIALYYLALYGGASAPVIAVGVVQRQAGLLTAAIYFSVFAVLISAVGLFMFRAKKG